MRRMPHLLAMRTTWSVYVFFFFQAEDGIRDLTVTGVQTCALPIWLGPAAAAVVVGQQRDDVADRAVPDPLDGLAVAVVGAEAQARDDREALRFGQIGRASCRERV